MKKENLEVEWIYFVTKDQIEKILKEHFSFSEEATFEWNSEFGFVEGVKITEKGEKS